MLDRELRELERALRASPRDRALAQRLLQALRRAGHVSEAPLGPLVEVEPVADPGFAAGDLALVVRRSWPRPSFAWLPEMEERVGEVWAVVRVERDGLAAILDVPAASAERWPGDPAIGRSFGFASLWRLSSS